MLEARKNVADRGGFGEKERPKPTGWELKVGEYIGVEYAYPDGHPVLGVKMVDDPPKQEIIRSEAQWQKRRPGLAGEWADVVDKWFKKLHPHVTVVPKSHISPKPGVDFGSEEEEDAGLPGRKVKRNMTRFADMTERSLAEHSAILREHLAWLQRHEERILRLEEERRK